MKLESGTIYLSVFHLFRIWEVREELIKEPTNGYGFLPRYGKAGIRWRMAHEFNIFPFCYAYLIGRCYFDAPFTWKLTKKLLTINWYLRTYDNYTSYWKIQSEKVIFEDQWGLLYTVKFSWRSCWEKVLIIYYTTWIHIFPVYNWALSYFANVYKCNRMKLNHVPKAEAVINNIQMWYLRPQSFFDVSPKEIVVVFPVHFKQDVDP
jgi:hypothetical protein